MMARGSRVAWSILERLGRFDGGSNPPYPIDHRTSSRGFSNNHLALWSTGMFFMKKQDAAKIYSLLCKQYPDARDSPAMLSKGSAFEVLILTILSAQTTDRAVLKVKEPLFSTYPTPVSPRKGET